MNQNDTAPVQADAARAILTPREHDHEHHGPESEDHEHALEWVDLVRIGLVALACLASWLGVWQHFTSFDVIALVATLVGGYPIFKEAVANLIVRRMTMELSMTIALGAALAIGEFFTALVIVLFVLIAEVLEGLTVGRGRRAIKDLLDLLPQHAFVQRGGVTTEIEAAEVRVGDVVLVKPGGRVPVDGVVVAGNSFVDQAPITGESMPVEKGVGATVYAGTINQSGVIEVRTENIGRDTAFGKIIEAVERAEQSRAPIQKTADRLAGYLVYFAIGCAVLTFLVTQDVRSTISVVIVAGACGIAAGTPLAVLGAIGRAARQGAIIKGGLYLEALGTVDTIVLDKTGTLTLGNPEVTGVFPCPGVTDGSCGGSRSDCRAALRASPCESDLGEGRELSLGGTEPEHFEYVPGKGIACSLGGEQIIVGNRGFLALQSIDTTPWPLPPITHPKCWWPAVDGCWGRSTSLTHCGPSPFRPSPNCERWACERSC